MPAAKKRAASAISHRRAALQVADRGYVLEMGQVALSGAARDLLHDRRIIDTYLGIGSQKAA